MSNYNHNHVEIAGRITKDPELKTTANGQSIVNFCMATTRTKAKAGSDGNKPTYFVPCTAWGVTAENICKFFHKGDNFSVIGFFMSSTYTDQQNVKHWTYSIGVHEFEFVESKAKQETPYDADRYSSQSTQVSNTPKFEDIADDEGLPF